MEFGWDRIPNLECFFVHRKQGLFFTWMIQKKNAGKQQNLEPMWKKLMIAYVWDAFIGDANRMKQSLNITQRCFSPVYRCGKNLTHKH